MIVSNDASERQKKIFKLCNNRRVDVIIFGTKEKLGNCIGQSNRAIIAITSDKFKNMILDTLPDRLEVNMGVINEWRK